jgi:hypothetical protein
MLITLLDYLSLFSIRKQERSAGEPQAVMDNVKEHKQNSKTLLSLYNEQQKCTNIQVNLFPIYTGAVLVHAL